MTRTFNEKIRCPDCGHVHTVETDFERWVRNHHDLDSRSAGIVRFDLDVLLHKYKVLCDGKGSREIQCMMFVEVKTFGSDVTQSQRDTLHILDQVMRNRMPNMHRTPRPQSSWQVRKVTSKMRGGQEVDLRLFGGHLLQMSAGCPETSVALLWDRREVSQQQLVSLLRFDLDPDTIKPVDIRRRSQSWKGRGSQMEFFRKL